MINHRWFRDWYSSYGMPSSYFVFDFETSGLSTHDDLILQVGYCHVVDNAAVTNEAFILDWTTHDRVDIRWLEDRLEATKWHMEHDRDTGEPTNKTYSFSVDRLKKEGHAPNDVLATVFHMMHDARARGEIFVGYNAWNYDSRIFVNHAREFLSKDFAFGANELLDPGVMEKASQLEMLPWPGEPLDQFYRRAYYAGTKPKPKWSLDKDVIPKYRLAERFSLDMSKAHHADFDCLATHHLIETFRDLGSKRSTEIKWQSVQPVEVSSYCEKKVTTQK